MTRIAIGFLLGLLAFGLRSSSGIDVFELPGLSSEADLWARGVALLLVAITIGACGRTFSGAPNEALLLGLGLGVLTEGLWGDLRAGSVGRLLPLAPVALVLLVLRDRRRAAEEPCPAAWNHPASIVAFLLAGASMALAFEPLRTTALRFGNGTAMEGAASGGAFLLLAAFGGLAFASPLRGGEDRAGSHAGLTAALWFGPAILVGWLALGSQAIQPLAYRDFLARFGLDRSLEGQIHVSTLTSILGWLLAAFAMGMTVSCARRRGELMALVLGASLGTALLASAAFAEPELAGLVGLAVVGALHQWKFPRPMKRRFAGGVALIFVVTSALQLRTRPDHPVYAWERFPRVPSETLVDRSGQFLIYGSHGSVQRVLLDRTEIAPTDERAGADAEQLRAALALAGPAPKVLLVGQLTPGRAMVLREGGAAVVDRTAAWWRSMPRLERYLFTELESTRPADGEVLSIADARDRFDAGDYDLVIAPAVPGVPSPPPLSLDAPEGTTIVAFVDAATDLAHRDLEGPALVTADGLHYLAVGLVSKNVEARRTPDAPAVIDVGEAIDSPDLGAYAFERPDERARRARAAITERIAAANTEGDWYELTAGLAKHFAAQEASSPWDTRAQGVELDHDALTHFLAAAVTRDPDRFTHKLWTDIADTLVGKRDVEAIWEWVEPVLEVWEEWPEGELALARADLESLDPDAAAERIARVGSPTSPRDKKRLRGVRIALAKAFKDAGRAEDAKDLLHALLKDDPNDREAWALLKPEPSDE